MCAIQSTSSSGDHPASCTKDGVLTFCLRRTLSKGLPLVKAQQREPGSVSRGRVVESHGGAEMVEAPGQHGDEGGERDHPANDFQQEPGDLPSDHQGQDE